MVLLNGRFAPVALSFSDAGSASTGWRLIQRGFAMRKFFFAVLVALTGLSTLAVGHSLAQSSSGSSSGGAPQSNHP
jgi:hypothetical protein